MLSLPSAAITAALCIGVIYLSWPQYYVAVTSADQHIQCILPTRTFRLNWIHSVEKTQWQENYQLVGSQLFLDTTRVQGFGAGVPSHLKIKQQDAHTIEFEVQQTLPELNWVVSRHMQGEIYMADQLWPIAQHVSDYQVIQIRPRQLFRWQAWQQGECP